MKKELAWKQVTAKKPTALEAGKADLPDTNGLSP